LELAHDQGTHEQIETAPHRGIRHAERSRQFATAPHLAMIVRQHGPEPAQRRGADGDAELRCGPTGQRDPTNSTNSGRFTK